MSGPDSHAWSQVLVAAADAETLGRLLPGAARIAGNAGAQLVALLVPPELPDLARVARLAATTPQALTEAQCRDVLDETQERIASLELPLVPRLEVRVGRLFLEVIRFVETHPVDLLVKEAEHRASSTPRRIGEAFRASTDQHLLRKCAAPVWLVEAEGDGVPGAPARVVAAVDVDEVAASEPETLRALNAHICEQLLGLAALGASEILFVHAWDAPGEGMLQRFVPADEVETALASYFDDVERGHRRALESLAEDLRTEIEARGFDCAVRLRLLRGSARRVLPEVMRRDRPELLVMGTVGRSGIPGLLIGNTAEDVLNAVDCSLLAVKPPGFVCPLDLS